jgi:hypothetical protein
MAIVDLLPGAVIADLLTVVNRRVNIERCLSMIGIAVAGRSPDQRS